MLRGNTSSTSDATFTTDDGGGAGQGAAGIFSDDFDTEFKSEPIQKYRGQGMLVEQDESSYIRLDVFHDGRSLWAFGATITNGNPSVKINSPIAAAATAVDCVSGCAMMLRRELLDELGGFDEDYFMYFEETDFCVRARRRGKQVHHAPVGEFLHEEGGTSKTVRLRTFLDFRRSQILFHRKHGGVAAAIAARGLLVLGSALRVPPLAALSLTGSSERARAQLSLHWNGLVWLINPFNSLVPDVDRSQ